MHCNSVTIQYNKISPISIWKFALGMAQSLSHGGKKLDTYVSLPSNLCKVSLCFFCKWKVKLKLHLLLQSYGGEYWKETWHVQIKPYEFLNAMCWSNRTGEKPRRWMHCKGKARLTPSQRLGLGRLPFLENATDISMYACMYVGMCKYCRRT